MKFRAPKATNILSLSAMFCAMTVICIFLASVLPSGRLTLYFLSSIFVAGLLVERQVGAAILMYISASLLSLLLTPNLITVLPYVLLFGHYGIGKFYIEKIDNRIIAYILKLVYFNIFILLIYIFARNVLLTGILGRIQPWLFFVLIQPVFAVFDFLYSFFMDFYYTNIRKRIIR